MENESALPCADKLVFSTKSDAQAEARTIKFKRGLKLKAYKCRHCQLWHLSSNHDS